MQNESLSVVKRQSWPGVGARGNVTDQLCCSVALLWFQGLGRDFAEEPVFRFEPATQASESSWIVLPGPADHRVTTRWASATRCRQTTSLSRRLRARIASRGVLPSASLRS
jgi:hypothetical protein